MSSATMHIEVADFYVREMVTRGIVTVSHVPTGEMVADVLTKALAEVRRHGPTQFVAGEVRDYFKPWDHQRGWLNG